MISQDIVCYESRSSMLTLCDIEFTKLKGDIWFSEC